MKGEAQDDALPCRGRARCNPSGPPENPSSQPGALRSCGGWSGSTTISEPPTRFELNGASGSGSCSSTHDLADVVDVQRAGRLSFRAS